MKEDRFADRLKEELQELDEQIEVEKPSEQALMLMLKRGKGKREKTF